MPRYVIAFESTHAAMAADAALASLPHVLIPVPREISAGCGMALSFEADGDGQAWAALDAAAEARPLAALFRAEEGGGYRSL